jgi:hypothetical protein
MAKGDSASSFYFTVWTFDHFGRRQYLQNKLAGRQAGNQSRVRDAIASGGPVC